MSNETCFFTMSRSDAETRHLNDLPRRDVVVHQRTTREQDMREKVIRGGFMDRSFLDKNSSAHMVPLSTDRVLLRDVVI